MYTHKTSVERCLLIHPCKLKESEQEDRIEFYDLASSTDIEILDMINVNCSEINPRYFISSGKLEEIKQLIKSLEVDLILLNYVLSPTQEKNLELFLKCRVVDRTRLILDIFAQRARTHEGKLQVELAQLQHLSTRLIRGWTHLERQKGGLGLRGPGETQLETDRRLIRERIKSINKKLEKVLSQREQTRRARIQAELPQVSIVGYTNAGKSTLFNQMTSANVYVQDQLFATLDPTLRRFDLPYFGPIILADTVGFIRHLPHKLIDAFKATLEESVRADLLLHIIDASSDQKEDNIIQVQNVLREINAHHIPQLCIHNKIDRLPHHPKNHPMIEYNAHKQPTNVWISALENTGLDLLAQAITEKLSSQIVKKRITISSSQGKLRSQLYNLGAVQSETVTPDGKILLNICLPKSKLAALIRENQP